MPAYTPNMKLAKPYESDNFDLELLNSNWDKIDSFPYVVESGRTTAYRSNIHASVAQYKKITWYYKKWSDGTLEAYAVANIEDWRCNGEQGDDGTWWSGYIRFNYPSLGQKTIFNRAAFVSQADNKSVACWVADVSSPGDGYDNASYESVRLVATANEDSIISGGSDKNIYLSFKGTWK